MQGDGSPPAAPRWARPPPGPPLSPQCHLQAGHPRGALPEVISPGLAGGNAPSSPFCSVPTSATGALGPRRAAKGDLVALLPGAPPAPAEHHEHHGGSAPPCASPCPRLPPKRRRGGSPGSPPAAGAHALLFTSLLRPGGSARHELFPLPCADREATRQLTHPTQLQKSVLTRSLLLLAHAASRHALRALFQPSAGCLGCLGPCAPRSRQVEVPQFTGAQPRGQNASAHPVFPPVLPKLGRFASRALRSTRSLGAGCESSVLAFSMGCPCRLGEKGKKWSFGAVPLPARRGAVGDSRLVPSAASGVPGGGEKQFAPSAEHSPSQAPWSWDTHTHTHTL